MEGADLVIDDVEGEDADGVLAGLPPAQPAKPDVVTGGHLGEHLAHRVEGGVEGPLLHRQPCREGLHDIKV